VNVTLERARELAVSAQLLSDVGPTDVAETIDRLGRLQLDPTSAVARSEQLVLWSRVGSYDRSEIHSLAFEERRLFEYWAHLVPTSDYGVHRETMRRHPRGQGARARYIREWLRANASFRRYVLDRLRREGPLRSRDLEDQARVPWRSGGWNDGKNVARMLEVLAGAGQIGVWDRRENERIWDLAERVLPVTEQRLTAAEVARRTCEQQLRSKGIARGRELGIAFDGALPGRERALRNLVRDGVAAVARVEGRDGEWYVDTGLLDRTFVPRTTLLSPFDTLISDRARTEELFDFRFRLEIYVPKEHRRYGYYVLPILHGNRLIGRIDPLFVPGEALLRINAVHAEPDAPPAAGRAIGDSIRELAGWLGADAVAYGEVPRRWRPELQLPAGIRPQ
jgi:uncharacterized protein YcaQ